MDSGSCDAGLLAPVVASAAIELAVVLRGSTRMLEFIVVEMLGVCNLPVVDNQCAAPMVDATDIEIPLSDRLVAKWLGLTVADVPATAPADPLRYGVLESELSNADVGEDKLFRVAKRSSDGLELLELCIAIDSVGLAFVEPTSDMVSSVGTPSRLGEVVVINVEEFCFDRTGAPDWSSSPGELENSVELGEA